MMTKTQIHFLSSGSRFQCFSKKERLIISNDKSMKISHKWRATESAILIGKNTALKDNPQLTTRLWKGANPIRVVLDQNLELQDKLNIFNSEAKTLIINNKKNSYLCHLLNN